MDSSDIEDRDDQRSGVPEYLQTKTAGLGLVKDALEMIFRMKGDSKNVGEMEDMPTEMYQPLQRAEQHVGLGHCQSKMHVASSRHAVV